MLIMLCFLLCSFSFMDCILSVVIVCNLYCAKSSVCDLDVVMYKCYESTLFVLPIWP